MKVLAILIAAAVAPSVPTVEVCARLDPELIHCPQPVAPRITELWGGKVTLAIEVNPDGSVHSSRVLSSSGHPAWVEPTQIAVTKWRYSASKERRVRVVPFDFQLGDP